jgi:hypothetical protein
MNHTLLISTLLATLALAACDKPTVVNVPPAAPGPAGPQGEAGSPGEEGSQGATGYQGAEGAQGETGYQGTEGAQGETGETGRTGDGTTVIVVPSEPTPAN